MQHKLTEYRADIQIYRAIAVLQVLLFHMKISGFSAGFLGVDIFFVISGYLMTILHSADSSAAGFYLRRARRLIPAYAATVMAVLLVAFFITVPTDFQQVGEQTAFASFLLSNVGFWLHNSYFSDSEFNPLLHLWSLGVECQFYLFFPLLIALARRVRLALPLIISLSLAACLIFVWISPKTAFFMLPMRIWEFGIGMWAASRSQPRGGGFPWGVLGVAGMLLTPLLPVEGEGRSLLAGHPALPALLIVCCTALALHWRLPNALVRSVPGRVARQLGDISYSLYLAHWPTLVLLHYVPFGGTRSGVTGAADAVLCIAAVILTTVVLYHVFERPGPRLFTPTRTGVVVMGLLVAGLLLPTYQLRRFDEADRRIFAAWTDRAVYRCGKVFRVRHPTETVCKVGGGNRGVVMLIGDSHADAVKQAFAAAASRHGLATYFAVDNTPLITAGLGDDWLVAEARRLNARAVFLHYAARNLNRQLIDEAAGALAKADIPAYILLPTPEYVMHVPQQLYAQRHDGSRFPVKSLADERRNHAVLLATAGRTPGITLLDPTPLLCTPTCRVTDRQGSPLYFDQDHLTLRGAAAIIPVIEPALVAVSRGHR